MSNISIPIPECPISLATPRFAIHLATPYRPIPIATPDCSITQATPDCSIPQATPDCSIPLATPDCSIPLAGYSTKLSVSPVTGRVVKVTTVEEERNYKVMGEDEMLGKYLPTLYEAHHTPGKTVIHIENCLHSFSDSASILDCKIGVRTFTEEEFLAARENPELRPDLYQRMVEVDYKEPTQVEHYLKKVALHRFMIWRDTISSTASLGFRVKGMRRKGVSYQHYKTLTSRHKIFKIILSFMKDFPWAAPHFLTQLQTLRQDFKNSKLFSSHEFIGTSLLFVVDRSRCQMWMIDLEKMSSVPPHVSIDHESGWVQGSYQDGYLLGLDNLISIFTDIVSHWTRPSKC